MNDSEFERILQAKIEAKKVYDNEIPTLLQQLKPFHAKNGFIRAYYDSNYHYVVKVKDMEILRVVKMPLKTRCYFNDTKYKGGRKLGYYQRMIKNYILRYKAYSVLTMENIEYGYADRLDHLYKSCH